MKDFSCPQNMYSLKSRDGRNICFAGGDGCYLFDETGKEYVDLWNGFGSVLLGYNDEDIVKGFNYLISNRALSLQAPTSYLKQLSRLLLEDYPHKSQIGIFPTGTSAVRAATLAALQKTGKDFVLSSGYHGWDVMWSKGTRLFEPNSYGVIDFYYIIEKLEELVHLYKDRVAAVVVSPDFSYFGNAFYGKLFSICKENKLLIIVDDVKCGYRYAWGPSLSPEAFPADIYVVSKCIANGARISCLIGNEDIMKHISDFCFTSFFDIYSTASAVITLKKIKERNVQQKIREAGDRLILGVEQIIKKWGLPISITGNGNLFQFVLASSELSEAFYQQCTDNGIALYKDDNQCPSYAFDDNALRKVLSKFEEVLSSMALMFPGLLGKDIPIKRFHLAAYYQTDGCAEAMDYDEKVSLITELLYR
ncbi:neamine transaminase/2'-deamino-2'-hydroxyneamine transaminase/neomycin C transaminase [Anaerobacterium chartisolvens]|uniref:Neamine transaminase/2'-deamino-2'-hydroxyneamine transaminase/neomycin C transaminase n=1 Tax=Anaerobacterium chartisolvens TaxID=1297424 RepID=A0A369ASD7_9FIRM|nr:aminotransferase class III-fold pyridoxal phosphate-dependent enzyme [Anaerobacterium chartisolvens]RCX11127.1 neamine transaminase/2'-deamino-2'-hydroxyneamine transaminase/neomycin C transaminase [Anaerobacterium chartisolvens]